jgi:hypothetical protein
MREIALQMNEGLGDVHEKIAQDLGGNEQESVDHDEGEDEEEDETEYSDALDRSAISGGGGAAASRGVAAVAASVDDEDP